MPKKNNRRKFGKPRSRDIQLKSKDQEYAIVVEKLGDCRFLCQCDDGTERIGKVKGSLRNRVYFNRDDYVLLALRPDFNSYSAIVNKESKEVADMIVKYYPQEVAFLKQNDHFKKIKNFIPGDEIEHQSDHEFDEFIKDNNNIELDLDDLDDI
jgi:initiation factor 1A